MAGLRLGRKRPGTARTAERVDADVRGTCDAAQVRVVRRLDSGLPDLVPGLVARLPERPQLGLRDLTHVPEQLGSECSVRVAANVVACERNAREVARSLLEVRRHRRRRLGADHDRVKHVARVPTLEDEPRQLANRRARDVRERAELRQPPHIELREPRRPQLDRRDRFVRDEDVPVAIDDRTARRLDPAWPERSSGVPRRDSRFSRRPRSRPRRTPGAGGRSVARGRDASVTWWAEQDLNL